MFSMSRLLAIARKEFIHVIRDWRSLVLAIAIPGMLILLFGYALNLDLKNVTLAVWDQSHSKESRELLSMFQGSEYFHIEGYYDNYRSIQDSIDIGNAMVAIVIPYDFAGKVNSGKNSSIQIIADGSDSNTARLAIAYANGIGLLYNRNIILKHAEIKGARKPSQAVELIPRAWYNSNMRSQNVIIPGIIAIVMVVIAAMLTSITVAKEWEMGTMEQLISTPIRAPEIVFGKVIPYFIIGMTDVTIAIFLGHWGFGVPLRGSIFLLYIVCALFLTGALFFGLMLSIKLKKQVMANQFALLGSYMPTLMLSGFVFAIGNMPVIIRYLTYIVPGRYFIKILRGIYLKGIGLSILWIDIIPLTLYAIIMITLANKRMKLKLE